MIEYCNIISIFCTSGNFSGLFQKCFKIDTFKFADLSIAIHSFSVTEKILLINKIISKNTKFQY
jgi:hypothetical protein